MKFVLSWLHQLYALNYHKKFVVPGWRNKLFILLYQCSDYWQMLIRGISEKKTLRFEK